MEEKKEVQVICPICKTEKKLNIPKTIINQAKQLTTISIQKGLVCDHHFQAFIDKNFKIRGYQKIDFELKPKNDKIGSKINEKGDRTDTNDEELFKNLFLDGNFIEYRPNKSVNKDYKRIIKMKNKNTQEKKMTLEEIYEEFWDLIDDKNSKFKELIVRDKRRKDASHIALIQ
ncbi:MAG: hypothetical protein EU539_13305 [Promethearchaeota archaeon]|nr:MAG: hypothetical protein EU539_13305 [Candidatus Lokiarchaeota archaeon]